MALRFVTFRFVALRFVALRFVVMRFGALRFVAFRFVAMRFGALRLVALRFVAFRFPALRLVAFLLLVAIGSPKSQVRCGSSRRGTQTRQTLGPGFESASGTLPVERKDRRQCREFSHAGENDADSIAMGL